MTRKETTDMLTEILIRDRLSDRKYFAQEVTLDYGTDHSKRVDVMQFLPKGVIYASDIEKGIFICYEIKSCIEDVYSGSGLNFFGEKNYIVTTMETYRKLTEDGEEKLRKYIREKHPESSPYFGFMVAVPSETKIHGRDAIFREFENPTPLCRDASDWKIYTPVQCREGPRKRSATELLFCMLRSRHNYTNMRD